MRRCRTANPTRRRGGGGGGGVGEGEASVTINRAGCLCMRLHKCSGLGARLTWTDRVAWGEKEIKKWVSVAERFLAEIFTRFAQAYSYF